MDQIVQANRPASDSVAAARRRQGHLAAGTVLVAVDLSEISEAVLLWACDYAAQTGSDLEVLHVVHDPSDAPGKYKSGNGDALRPMVDTAQGMMSQFMERSRRDHPGAKPLKDAQTLVREGLPVDAILEMAEKRGASLVVLGCRQRNALQRFLLGSTAEKVLERSRVPVTVVKAKH